MALLIRDSKLSLPKFREIKTTLKFREITTKKAAVVVQFFYAKMANEVLFLKPAVFYKLQSSFEKIQEIHKGNCSWQNGFACPTM